MRPSGFVEVAVVPFAPLKGINHPEKEGVPYAPSSRRPTPPRTRIVHQGYVGRLSYAGARRPRQAAGPIWCSDCPDASTATVTGISVTSNS